MVLPKTLYRSIAIIMVCLILMLSFLVGLDHHICSDTHCMICSILRPLTERYFLTGSKFQFLMITALALFACASLAVPVQLYRTPVHQKDKITS